jgi:ectoine hydroxylase-related dioxygenase (phytanoyl-CoA dioxygenase family)
MPCDTRTEPSATIRAVKTTVRTVGVDTAAVDIAAVLREDGCVVIGNASPPEFMDQVVEELEPHLSATDAGNTEFLGYQTRRTGALIARSPSVRKLVTHPAVLDTLDLVLGDHASTYQVDLTQLIDIAPGEPAQQIHRDQWSFDHFAFPSGFEVEVGTMWAATDFTEEMGATRVVVGSNRWEDDPDDVDPSLAGPAEMSKGSVLLYTGSIFHGGGANKSQAHRIGINIGYSLGWLRQEENQFLACPPEVARALPEGLLRLMGYQRGAHSLGYVDSANEPLEWLYGVRSPHTDYLAYARSARKLLRRTEVYTPPPVM